MPPVSRYMTRQPWTIRKGANVAEALRLMKQHRIRHLPVLDDDRVVGILSERDIRSMEALFGANPEAISVSDAMMPDVVTVTTDAPMDQVVERMAEDKLGSTVVVTNNGQLEGIFTTIDALQFFAELLRRVAA